MDNIKTIPCPNNIPGCCVLHLATEEVVTHPAESKNIGGADIAATGTADT